MTSKAMLRAMYQARYRNYRGILYLFPSKSDVLDFSKGRISPLIDDNPETIGKWVHRYRRCRHQDEYGTPFFISGAWFPGWA